MNYQTWYRWITGQEWRKVYTLQVFGEKFMAVKRTKRVTFIEKRGWGIMGWNPENAHEPGRLPSSGCFTWVGCRAARAAALEYLSRPDVTQVKVCSNQLRALYLWNKHSDGTVSGYAPGE